MDGIKANSSKKENFSELFIYFFCLLKAYSKLRDKVIAKCTKKTLKSTKELSSRPSLNPVATPSLNKFIRLSQIPNIIISIPSSLTILKEIPLKSSQKPPIFKKKVFFPPEIIPNDV